MDVWDMIKTERLRLADDLESLSDEQLSAPSACEGWTVRQAAAHTVMPFTVSTPKFLWGIAMNRGNFNKFALKESRKISSAMSHAEVVQTLRSNAENQWTPPGKRFGPEIPLTEVIVHGQDIRRPLGLDHSIPQETIDYALGEISDETIREDYRNRIG